MSKASVIGLSDAVSLCVSLVTSSGGGSEVTPGHGMLPAWAEKLKAQSNVKTAQNWRKCLILLSPLESLAKTFASRNTTPLLKILQAEKRAHKMAGGLATKVAIILKGKSSYGFCVLTLASTEQ
jgi:hypothetical protein